MSRSRIDRVFLVGLATVVPIAVTAYVVWWLIWTAETALRSVIVQVIEPDHYWPGVGLLFAVLFIYLIGLFMSAYVARAALAMGERVIARIPIVKSIYGMLADMVGFFTQRKEARFSKVVMLRLDDEARILGLVTREDFEGLPAGIGGRDVVGVYLPMSYQIGGFTVMVPRARLEPLAMSMEDAMRFAMTAGVGGKTEPVPAKR